MEHSLLIPSLIRSFQPEFEGHYDGGCQGCRTAVPLKILDLDEGRGQFVYTRPKKGIATAG